MKSESPVDSFFYIASYHGTVGPSHVACTMKRQKLCIPFVNAADLNESMGLMPDLQHNGILSLRWINIDRKFRGHLFSARQVWSDTFSISQ